MQEQLICPYPGLRPFNEDESIFFKGRDEHIEQIVKQLEEKKFLMLTGASGDGKSSLIYAGVIPNARAGFFKAKFNNWIVADFRPEREPLTNMATAISDQLKINDIPRIEKELSYGFSSLIDIYKSSPYWIDQQSETFTQLTADEQKKAKRKGANLLILVDQFEEFFTNPENYHNGKCSIESQAVINSLLETTRLAIEQDVPIYIVCTMRSDYIGQCASFRGLPEYIGYSQFFVPRLKRKEIYQVIEEPAQLNGNKISKRLVEMLINEMNDGIDQLPVLQHSLNQIWQKANSGQVEMDIIHFAKINGIPKNQLTPADKEEFETWFNTIPEFKKEFFTQSSLGDVLDAHANELFETANSFSETITDHDAKLIVETAFKCLTKIDESRAVRNRMTLEEVTQIINQPHITTSIVAQVLYVFRVQGNTFLKPFIFDVTAEAKELSGSSVLDITHESLIRNWKKLTDWAKDEYDNLITWQDFNKQLQRWTDSNKSSDYLLPIGPLTFFENWFNTAKPNTYWLVRYDEREVNQEKKLQDAEITLNNAKQFIKRSARRLFINRTVIKYGADKIIAVFGILLMVFGCTYFYFDFRKKQNDYVIIDLQEKSKELLKSKYISNKEKADYILKSEMLNTGSYESLLNLFESDSVKNEIVQEMLIKCLQFEKNEEENEPENPLISIFMEKQIDYINRNRAFSDNKKYVHEINNINLVVYSQIILRDNNYKLSHKKINSKYKLFCNNAKESFKKLLLDSALLRGTDINQFNKLLQIVPELVNYDKNEIAIFIENLTPFNSNSNSLFKILYPKSKSVQAFYNEKITHNSGYFQIANLYALVSDFDNLNRAFDSIVSNNTNFLTISRGGYSYNRILYSLLLSNSLCSEKGIEFMKNIELKITNKKLFTIEQLLADKISSNSNNVGPYSLSNIFNKEVDAFKFSGIIDKITAKQRIDYIDFVISKTIEDSKLEANSKNFIIALLLKTKAKCYNLSNNVDYLKIDEALNLAYQYYGKINDAYINSEINIGGENGGLKSIKRSELFLYPGNIELTDYYNTFNVYYSGYDKSYLINFISKNKSILDKFFLNNNGIEILNRFMKNYSSVVLNNANKSNRYNFDFIETLNKSNFKKDLFDKDYANCLLGLYYHKKGNEVKSKEYFNKVIMNKVFSKETLNGEDKWTYTELAEECALYYATRSFRDTSAANTNKLKFYSTLSNLPFEYLKRNTIIKTIDSLMSRNMDQFAIELTDTLLNVYINKKPKFGNSFFKILGRYATTNSSRIAMNLLKDKTDKTKPSCLNFFINGLLQTNRYYEATTFIPDYVSSSNQLKFYTSFIKNEARKKTKNYKGWGNLDEENNWTDEPFESSDSEREGSFYFF
jgi:energy-coupling factor transporter ATP-binding protein EcfA2